MTSPTAAPASYAPGDAVHVVRGTNSNDTVRENVPAVVVGCRGMVVVVNRTDPGRFHGEGLWAFTSDLIDSAAAPTDLLPR